MQRLTLSLGLALTCVGTLTGQAALPASTPAASDPAPSSSDTRYTPTRLHPQLTLPLPASERLTSSDAAYDLWVDRSYAFWRALPEAPRVPGDSIRTAIETRGRAWLAQLSAKAPDVLHLEDAGRVHVVAGADSIARRYFAQRLASPKLSSAERGYTLLAAATGFTDTAHAERLAVAEEYAAMLDRLPDLDAGVYGFRAHSALAQAYDGLGQRDAALHHALRAFALVGRVPMRDREEAYTDPALYMVVAHALQGDPNARTRRAVVTEALRAAAAPFPGMTAADTSALWKAAGWRDSLALMAGSGDLIGEVAPPIRAHAWWNMSAPSRTEADSQAGSLSLNDGIVRLVLFGNVYCCMDNMLTLQRMQAELPKGASTLVVTATAGHIGGVLVSPDEEVRQLRGIYLDTLHFTIPIAVWAGPKQPTPWGGMMPTPTPNLKAYSVSHSKYGGQSEYAPPYLAVIDGRGVVRHIFSAVRGFTRDDQLRAMVLIRTLASNP